MSNSKANEQSMMFMLVLGPVSQNDSSYVSRNNGTQALYGDARSISAACGSSRASSEMCIAHTGSSLGLVLAVHSVCMTGSSVCRCSRQTYSNRVCCTTLFSQQVCVRNLPTCLVRGQSLLHLPSLDGFWFGRNDGIPTQR